MLTICVLLSRAFQYCIWHTGNYICCRWSHCLQLAGELFLFNLACVSGVEREGNLVARPRSRNKREGELPVVRLSRFSRGRNPLPLSFQKPATQVIYNLKSEQLYVQLTELTDLAFLCKEHNASLPHFVCIENWRSLLKLLSFALHF